MGNFLLEILVEEIPARFQAGAIAEFEKLMTAEFDKQKISYSDVKSFISPRRIFRAFSVNNPASPFPSTMLPFVLTTP